eukprot:scaffold285509_cov45-Prasinocladus_malaysianus.AAC.1
MGAIAGAVMSFVGTQKVTEAVTNLLEETVQEKGIQNILAYMDKLQQVAYKMIEVASQFSDGAGGGFFDPTALIGTLEGVQEQ